MQSISPHSRVRPPCLGAVSVIRLTDRFLLVSVGVAAIGLFASTLTFAACVDADFVRALPSPASPASLRKITAGFGCYSIFTGDWANCAFTYRVVGLAQPASDLGNNGGHVAHSGVRPLVLNDVRNPGGAVQYAHDADPSPLGVSGFTLQTPPFGQATVRHPTPEISGRLAVDTTIAAPPGGFFCLFDPAGRTLTTHAIIDIAVPDLELLASTGTDHEVVRGGTAEHPDGTFGSVDSLAILLKVSQEYNTRALSKLSVNDLSLSSGGLFDINSDWRTPHNTHRAGLDADINRTNVNGATSNCVDDKALNDAVLEVAAGATFPRLFCESGGRKHIDLR